MTSEQGITSKLTIAITPANGVAATSDINGVTLDMQGFEGVMVTIAFGVITSGAVTTIKMQQDSASGMGTAQDLLGTSQTITDTDDEKTFYIDLVKPEKQYVRLVVPRATQNAVIASATYLQYRARKAPTTHGTNVAGETHISPIEGTA